VLHNINHETSSIIRELCNDLGNKFSRFERDDRHIARGKYVHFRFESDKQDKFDDSTSNSKYKRSKTDGHKQFHEHH
jgi:hypothetical protein